MTLPSREQPRRKSRKNTEFWRACGYLGAYRRIVTISIVCAFFVGAITTGGLVAMLPILRVLINHDTVQNWADRQIVERRIGVSFSDDPGHPIVSLKEDGRAARAGLRTGDKLPIAELAGTAPFMSEIATSHGPVV